MDARTVLTNMSRAHGRRLAVLGSAVVAVVCALGAVAAVLDSPGDETVANALASVAVGALLVSWRLSH